MLNEKENLLKKLNLTTNKSAKASVNINSNITMKINNLKIKNNFSSFSVAENENNKKILSKEKAQNFKTSENFNSSKNFLNTNYSNTEHSTHLNTINTCSFTSPKFSNANNTKSFLMSNNNIFNSSSSRLIANQSKSKSKSKILRNSKTAVSSINSKIELTEKNFESQRISINNIKRPKNFGLSVEKSPDKKTPQIKSVSEFPLYNRLKEYSNSSQKYKNSSKNKINKGNYLNDINNKSKDDGIYPSNNNSNNNNSSIINNRNIIQNLSNKKEYNTQNFFSFKKQNSNTNTNNINNKINGNCPPNLINSYNNINSILISTKKEKESLLNNIIQRSLKKSMKINNAATNSSDGIKKDEKFHTITVTSASEKENKILQGKKIENLKTSKDGKIIPWNFPSINLLIQENLQNKNSFNNIFSTNNNQHIKHIENSQDSYKYIKDFKLNQYLKSNKHNYNKNSNKSLLNNDSSQQKNKKKNLAAAVAAVENNLNKINNNFNNNPVSPLSPSVNNNSNSNAKENNLKSLKFLTIDVNYEVNKITSIKNNYILDKNFTSNKISLLNSGEKPANLNLQSNDCPSNKSNEKKFKTIDITQEYDCLVNKINSQQVPYNTYVSNTSPCRISNPYQNQFITTCSKLNYKDASTPNRVNNKKKLKNLKNMNHILILSSGGGGDNGSEFIKKTNKIFNHSYEKMPVLNSSCLSNDPKEYNNSNLNSNLEREFSSKNEFNDNTNYVNNSNSYSNPNKYNYSSSVKNPDNINKKNSSNKNDLKNKLIKINENPFIKNMKLKNPQNFHIKNEQESNYINSDSRKNEKPEFLKTLENHTEYKLDENSDSSSHSNLNSLLYDLNKNSNGKGNDDSLLMENKIVYSFRNNQNKYVTLNDIKSNFAGNNNLKIPSELEKQVSVSQNNFLIQRLTDDCHCHNSFNNNHKNNTIACNNSIRRINYNNNNNNNSYDDKDKIYLTNQFSRKVIQSSMKNFNSKSKRDATFQNFIFSPDCLKEKILNRNEMNDDMDYSIKFPDFSNNNLNINKALENSSKNEIFKNCDISNNHINSNHNINASATNTINKNNKINKDQSFNINGQDQFDFTEKLKKIGEKYYLFEKDDIYAINNKNNSLNNNNQKIPKIMNDLYTIRDMPIKDFNTLFNLINTNMRQVNDIIQSEDGIQNKNLIEHKNNQTQKDHTKNISAISSEIISNAINYDDKDKQSSVILINDIKKNLFFQDLNIQTNCNLGRNHNFSRKSFVKKSNDYRSRLFSDSLSLNYNEFSMNNINANNLLDKTEADRFANLINENLDKAPQKVNLNSNQNFEKNDKSSYLCLNDILSNDIENLSFIQKNNINKNNNIEKNENNTEAANNKANRIGRDYDKINKNDKNFIPSDTELIDSRELLINNIIDNNINLQNITNKSNKKTLLNIEINKEMNNNNNMNLMHPLATSKANSLYTGFHSTKNAYTNPHFFFDFEKIKGENNLENANYVNTNTCIKKQENNKNKISESLINYPSKRSKEECNLSFTDNFINLNPNFQNFNFSLQNLNDQNLLSKEASFNKKLNKEDFLNKVNNEFIYEDFIYENDKLDLTQCQYNYGLNKHDDINHQAKNKRDENDVIKIANKKAINSINNYPKQEPKHNNANNPNTINNHVSLDNKNKKCIIF